MWLVVDWLIDLDRDVSDNMTGIVYTDEGGQEQSLLGKLVYTTDETGSRNIILQVDNNTVNWLFRGFNFLQFILDFGRN